MKSSEILELVRAGYTKEEIAAMDTDKETPTDTKTEPAAPVTPPKEDKPEPKPDNKPEPAAPVHTPTESEKLLAALGLKLDGLTQAVQASNVNRIEGKPNAPTTDDILAAIINPHLNDKPDKEG